MREEEKLEERERERGREEREEGRKKKEISRETEKDGGSILGNVIMHRRVQTRSKMIGRVLLRCHGQRGGGGGRGVAGQWCKRTFNV